MLTLSLDFDLPSACRPWFEAVHSFVLACQKLGQRGPTADYDWVTVVAFVGFHCDTHGPRNENPNVETYFHFPGLGRMTWAKASKTLGNLAAGPIWPVLWVEKDLEIKIMKKCFPVTDAAEWRWYLASHLRRRLHDDGRWTKKQHWCSKSWSFLMPQECCSVACNFPRSLLVVFAIAGGHRCPGSKLPRGALAAQWSLPTRKASRHCTPKTFAQLPSCGQKLINRSWPLLPVQSKRMLHDAAISFVDVCGLASFVIHDPGQVGFQWVPQRPQWTFQYCGQKLAMLQLCRV